MHEFVIPVFQDWTEWAMCPVTGEPIIFKPGEEQLLLWSLYDRAMEIFQKDMNDRMWSMIMADVWWKAHELRGYW